MADITDNNKEPSLKEYVFAAIVYVFAAIVFYIVIHLLYLFMTIIEKRG